MATIAGRDFTLWECRLNAHTLRVDVARPIPPARLPTVCGWCEKSKLGPCAKHGGLRGVQRRHAYNALRMARAL